PARRERARRTTVFSAEEESFPRVAAPIDAAMTGSVSRCPGRTRLAISMITNATTAVINHSPNARRTGPFMTKQPNGTLPAKSPMNPWLRTLAEEEPASPGLGGEADAEADQRRAGDGAHRALHTTPPQDLLGGARGEGVAGQP